MVPGVIRGEVQILRSGIEAIRCVLLNGIHHASRSGKPQAGRDEGEWVLRGLVPWYYHCGGLSAGDFALGYESTETRGQRSHPLGKSMLMGSYVSTRRGVLLFSWCRGVCHGENPVSGDFSLSKQEVVSV